MSELKDEKSQSFFSSPYGRRMELLRSQLRRGDKKEIAMRAGVCETWVSLVFSGKGISRPVLDVAEHIINERNQNQ